MVKKMDLGSIEDDIGFFPPYQAVSIVRDDVLAAHAELKPLLAKLEGAISGEDMVEMNYQVDVEGRTPREVAVAFLQSKGLV